MLAITAKVKLLKKEVTCAISLTKDIIGSLKGLNPSSDYRTTIGIFAVQAPDWKILMDEKSKMINVIREVCTGEKAPQEAISIFEKVLCDLNEINTWLQVPSK